MLRSYRMHRTTHLHCLPLCRQTKLEIMNFEYYLEEFRKAAVQIDKKVLSEKQLEVYFGVALIFIVSLVKSSCYLERR